jgi:hypothetical protein
VSERNRRALDEFSVLAANAALQADPSRGEGQLFAAVRSLHSGSCRSELDEDEELPTPSLPPLRREGEYVEAVL